MGRRGWRGNWSVALENCVVPLLGFPCTVSAVQLLSTSPASVSCFRVSELRCPKPVRSVRRYILRQICAVLQVANRQSKQGWPPKEFLKPKISIINQMNRGGHRTCNKSRNNSEMRNMFLRESMQVRNRGCWTG